MNSRRDRPWRWWASPIGQFLIRWEYKVVWNDLRSVYIGPIRYGTYFIPLVGYAILFNDFVASKLTFDIIAEDPQLFPSEWRLRSIYFGLVLISLGGIIYNWKCPRLVKRFSQADLFAKHAISEWTYHEFIEMRPNRREAHATVHGKVYDSDVDDAYDVLKKGDRELSRPQLDVLKSVCFEHYEKQNIQTEVTARAFAYYSMWSGFILLAIPSFMLFVDVVRSLF